MVDRFRGGATTEPTGPREVPQIHREPGHPGRTPQGPNMDRRKFLGLGGAGVLAVGGMIFGPEIFSGNPKLELRDGEKTTYFEPFVGENANRIAKDLGINAGTFFITTNEAMDKMTVSGAKKGSYLKQETLLPIFPPAVHAQGEIIAQVAKEVHVPANVLATIATIESAGNIHAESDADAHGPVQVVPKYHFDKILQVANKRGFEIPGGEELLTRWQRAKDAKTKLPNVSTPEVQAALQDPYIGYKVGAMVLKDEFENVKNMKKLNEDHPSAWTRAMNAYNGGADEAQKDYKSPPLQSILYGVYGIRFFMTSEIAAQMRESGMNDVDIAKELISPEIDARTYAFIQTKKGRVNDVNEYERLWAGLSTEQLVVQGDPQLTAEMNASYKEHRSGQHKFDYPVSAGLRLWLAHGGEGIYFQAPGNENKALYPANQ